MTMAQEHVNLSDDPAPLAAPRSNRLRGISWMFSILTAGVLAVAVAATVTSCVPHVPREHDEFCNLLLADTLLHGRLANPTPEIWQPLQSFHVIMQPSYAAKYPLALAVLVAAGIAAFEAPIVGSWLAAGLCASATVWMLAGITSRRWAFFGGVLIALHPAMQITWSQSLFGGWLTATAASLVLGAVLRLRRKHIRPLPALLMGCGIGLLALTRPFEGLVFSVSSAAALLFAWSPVRLSEVIDRTKKLALPVGLPVLCALSLIALQNFSASGTPLRMPYQLHEQQYGVAPLFVFQTPHQPSYESSGYTPDVVSQYHRGWSLDSYMHRNGIWGWIRGVLEATSVAWSYWGLSLTLIPALTCLFWLPYRVGRSVVLMIAIQLAASALVCWVFPHYLAPLLPLLVVATVMGTKHAKRRIFGSSSAESLRLTSAIVALQIFLLLVGIRQLMLAPNNAWAQHRQNVVDQLSELTGDHLVLVEYGPNHNVHQEWVYNLSDLENQKILWARAERDTWAKEMISEYESRRSIWRMRPDSEIRPRLISTPSAFAGTKVN